MWCPQVRELLDGVGWTPQEIDHYAFHQPGQAVLERIFSDLDAKPSAGVFTHSLYGNTASTAWARLWITASAKGPSATATRSSSAVPPPVSRWWPAAAEWVLSASLHRAVSDHQQDVPDSGFGRSARSRYCNCALRFRRPPCGWTDLLPGYHKSTVDRPVFIVGNPRSGTTFLHRLLLGSGDDLAAFELWEMCSPAITARKVLGPIVPRVRPVLTGALPPLDIHDTNLRGIETDDVLWFFRTMDGPFAWAFSLPGKTPGAVPCAGARWASRG